MIVIEATHIYYGGGFTLLKVLLDKLEQEKIYTKVFLNYQDIVNTLLSNDYKYINLIKGDLFSMLVRYLQKRDNILFFCNLPPFTKQKHSLLYFHNIHILEENLAGYSNYKRIMKVKNKVYNCWLRGFHKNVFKIGCQTDAVKQKLKSFGIEASLLPFYEPIISENVSKIYDFCYVSSAAPHKNHKSLVEAIDLLAQKREFRIALTIENKPYSLILLNLINNINEKYNREIIVNLGPLDRIGIIRLYSESRALYFPSIMETLGLPLIEAIECNLKVLSSDRKFTYDVLANPIVFDPNDPIAIAETMNNFLDGQYQNIYQRILFENKLDEIVNFLNLPVNLNMH